MMTMNRNDKIKEKVRGLIKDGLYDQHAIFNTLYPTFTGHYSRLRNLISEVKNKGV